MERQWQLRILWPALLPALVIGVLITLATIVQMTLLSWVVSAVFLLHQHLSQVMAQLYSLLGVLLVRACFMWGREVLVQRAARAVTTRLRQQVMKTLFARGPAYCDDERTGELVATAYEGIERLDAYMSRYLPQLVMSVLTPLLIASYLFTIDWMSALLLLISCPIIPLLMVLVGGYTKRRTERQWSELTYMSAHFLDAVQGLPTLKLFGRGNAERKRVARVSERFRTATLQVLRLASLSGMVLELMIAFAIGLVAVMLGVRVIDGSIAFASAFLILLLTPEFYRPLRELGVHYHAGIEGKAAAKRIAALLTPTTTTVVGTRCIASARQFIGRDSLISGDKSPPDAIHRVPTKKIHSSFVLPPAPPFTIQLTHVGYRYDGSTRPALDDVTLTLPGRTCTAVVGRSGAGKSTLVNVLLGFLEVQQGTITVNGLPLNDIDIECWREQVALIPQRPYLFYGSVLENIRMARPTARMQEVEQAARDAGASEFIELLPQGYETLIGERGTRLSAGQAQRVALARAFLKEAPFVILDEPTSSLDPQSELLIRKAIEQLMANRTVLVIAHRLNTIARASQIVVLDQGRVVECGQHRELVRQQGIYARMVQAVTMEDTVV